MTCFSVSATTYAFRYAQFPKIRVLLLSVNAALCNAVFAEATRGSTCAVPGTVLMNINNVTLQLRYEVVVVDPTTPSNVADVVSGGDPEVPAMIVCLVQDPADAAECSALVSASSELWKGFMQSKEMSRYLSSAWASGVEEDDIAGEAAAKIIFAVNNKQAESAAGKEDDTVLKSVVAKCGDSCESKAYHVNTVFLPVVGLTQMMMVAEDGDQKKRVELKTLFTTLARLATRACLNLRAK
eukprot:PhM_4_TR7451/c0_g1_i1/m.88793